MLNIADVLEFEECLDYTNVDVITKYVSYVQAFIFAETPDGVPNIDKKVSYRLGVDLPNGILDKDIDSTLYTFLTEKFNVKNKTRKRVLNHLVKITT